MNDQSFDSWIESLTGQPVGKRALYREALTHGSHGKRDYQRLEFLGDRVLGLAIANALYDNFPHESEGRLAQMLNELVSGQSCARIARQLQLGDRLLLGKQADNDGGRDSDNILGDVMEALIGALYCDAGFEAARDFVLRQWAKPLAQVGSSQSHPKSALQEWAAANQRKPPVYTLVDSSGPAHDPRFTIRVEVAKVGDMEATATSKQAAETAAAKAFLEQYT